MPALIRMTGPHRTSTLAEPVRCRTDASLYLRAPLDLAEVAAIEIGDQVIPIVKRATVSRRVHLREAQWLSQAFPAGTPVFCLGPSRGERGELGEQAEEW